MLSLALMGALGLGLAFLALRNGQPRKTPSLGGSGLQRDLDRLFADISRGLRAVTASSRMGGFAVLQEKHAEVGRLLSEMQRRLRMLEDGARKKYEARAHRILAQAARVGITLPPP